ncbi:hemolysin [Lentinula raphanica]|nr:hemolysin [Lentinula raphanica]
MKILAWLTLVLCTFLTLAAPTEHKSDSDATICGHRHGIPVGTTPGKSAHGLCIELLFSSILVLLGGLFAGLTLGLMGLDELHLRVLAAASDDPREKQDAQAVLRLMNRGRHWVLVVLLLSNVITNETLPIFLDGALGGGLPAILISTASIGEMYRIIPQAVCVRYGLSIGAKCVPFVLALMWILAPVAYPIARILDYTLGTKDGHMYKKSQLKSFLQLHRTGAEPLQEEEIGILSSVLELGAKDVKTIMTPIKDVVKLSADAILNQDTLAAILASGCSRIPVYDPNVPSGSAFIGLLLVKRLLQYDHLLNLPIRDFPLSVLPEAPPSICCFQALDYFQTGRAHLLLISRTPGIAGGAIGIITLEDIIEEIIAKEIVDETDLYEDNVSKRMARRLATARVMQGIVERRQRDTSSTVSSSASTLAGLEDVMFKDVDEVSLHDTYAIRPEQDAHRLSFERDTNINWFEPENWNLLSSRNYGTMTKR